MKDGTKLDLIVAHTNLFFPGIGNLTPTIDLASNVNSKLKGATMTIEGSWVVLNIAGRQYPVPTSNIALSRIAKD